MSCDKGLVMGNWCNCSLDANLLKWFKEARYYLLMIAIRLVKGISILKKQYENYTRILF